MEQLWEEIMGGMGGNNGGGRSNLVANAANRPPTTHTFATIVHFDQEKEEL